MHLYILLAAMDSGYIVHTQKNRHLPACFVCESREEQNCKSQCGCKKLLISRSINLVPMRRRARYSQMPPSHRIANFQLAMLTPIITAIIRPELANIFFSQKLFKDLFANNSEVRYLYFSIFLLIYFSNC